MIASQQRFLASLAIVACLLIGVALVSAVPEGEMRRDWKAARQMRFRQVGDAEPEGANDRNSTAGNSGEDDDDDEQVVIRNRNVLKNKKHPNGEAASHAHDISLSQACTVSMFCPDHWENKGKVGILYHNPSLKMSPFPVGGPLNHFWTWVHPFLCCAKSDAAEINTMYTFSQSCPPGAREFGLAGLIHRDSDLQKQPFTHHFGAAWGWQFTWTHPVICQQTEDIEHLKKSNNCVLGRTTCPDGFKDRGMTGILFQNSEYDKNPFPEGGNVNANWRWAHPRLCCTY